ncbi:MAG: hypothetical protein FWD60_09010 [Candidatus Azobacteroides sp.]|nr:hypothetical protein [Candidatus Azobacteroides sp.]
MGTILNRIEQIAHSEGIKIATLERAIGASKGVLSRAINNGTDIQFKWIQAIVENYPSYSEEWLLTGNGSMLKPSVGVNNTISGDRNVGSVGGHYVNIASNNMSEQNRIISEYEKEIQRLLKLDEKLQQTEKDLLTRIKFLEREIESLKEVISSKNELLDMYKKNQQKGK